MTEAELHEELQIINAARADPGAFGQLYEKYFDRIFNFIYRQTDDEELTGDLTSQTFLQALNHLPRYVFRGVPFSAWLFKIAANEVNKHYRKKKKLQVFSIEENLVRDLVDESWDEERIQQMILYLNELPTEMLQILELRFFEDKDFKEIAFILDISESGAKMRTYRALDKLRQKFNLEIRYDGKK